MIILHFQTFPGIQTVGESQRNDLQKAITAQYFRIFPKEYEQMVCMQSEFYGCIPEKGKLTKSILL